MSDNLLPLTQIATELLLNEVARRAASKNMTVAQLVSEADANWNKAEAGAEDLSKAGEQ